MDIYNKGIIFAFQIKHPNARKSLAEWTKKIMAAQWHTFADIKKTFNTIDYAAPFCIFDVGGNKYRVIAIVSFAEKTVLIDKVLTHAQYNRWRLK
jgi:mRNA interferase HigB